ncbi:MAG: PQQ-binding-like beta-propeller repeat protein [Planctomycetota bacterium]
MVLSRSFLLLATLAVFGLTSLGPAADWPQWRGPDGEGHAVAKNLPVTWSETQNVAWKTPLPGRGWSSPVIEGNEIWLTTAVESPLSEEGKKQLLAGNTGDQALNLSGRLSMRAVCIDRATGQLLHDVEVLVEEHPDPVHSLNSFASPSPVIENGRLYCHFGTNGTACLDTKTQKIVWTNRELRLKHENGPGSSPILWGDLLIFHCDGSDVQYIVALRKQTGEVAWKTNRSGTLNENSQLKKAYGTPLVIDVAGRPQLISPGADWLYGYDPATGSELWKLSYGVLGFSIVPRPVQGNGLVYFSTSFMQPELLAVRVNGESGAEIEWRYKKQAPQMPSPLLVGSELYIVSDKGIATCLNAATGDPLWSERLGGNFSSSPLLADGRIYVSNREGMTYVLAPGSTYDLLASNQLDGSIMATPAALDNALFIRTDQALYRIEKK